MVGTQLPSIRAMVEELGISRNTILNALEQLVAEGYLDMKHGSGTYVAQTLPDTMLNIPKPQQPLSSQHRFDSSLSQQVTRLIKAPNMPLPRVTSSEEKPRAFLATVPDVDAFPHTLWSKLLAKSWKSMTHSELLMYSDSGAGYRPLREAIAAYLGLTRGVRCTAEQIIIVAGSQQGLSLTAQVLLNAGDHVWLADPAYLGAVGAFIANDARICPIPVSPDGIDVERGIRKCPQARLAYVMPSHQFPLGVTMSLSRRLQLLEWANKNDAWILEDDYDGEYRYSGRPLAALQSLDGGNRVIYLGTFSKVLFPALRLGYLVLPAGLEMAFLTALSFATAQPPILEQMVLASFISEGHFARHIRRMRTLYGERQAVLINAARRELSGLLDIQPAEAGMHLLGWLPSDRSDTDVSAELAAHGIDTHPLSTYSLEANVDSALLLGYSALNNREIEEGVQQLARVLRT